ncbi:beta-galactosidase [Pseudomonas sp. RIT-PI-AD]|uniref:beta-galactosidase n=1 Tax=Pseudomonas sp. RIT-PI-AD TaxID=3035294 RepID=UPI0021D8C9DF|nr:beta-galactosidase [Pseudomonas sp. RIT-PI-AD]
MKERVASILPALGRPVLIGEYPYYRASPTDWEANLNQLKRNGIDVVSFYIPWRFHEVRGADALHFDFSGATDPQRDLLRLLRLISAAGLKAVVKPGPFIHAEVQLGGLPDRLCDEQRYCPITGITGKPLLSQGRRLPSLFDPAVRLQVGTWLEEVEDRVVRPHAAPAGPIVALQLGNEGIFSDAGLPLERQDASAPALTAFWAWMQGREQDATALEKRTLGESLDVLHSEWPRWAGVAMLDAWRWLDGFHSPRLPRLVNVPLVRPDAQQNAFAGWMARHLAFRDSGYHVGHTEWVGNAASDRGAFMSHLLGIVAGRTDTLEANWGFTWADASFAQPHVPLFHALLGLLLGSTSCSVYTACATEHWGQEIDLDPQGLRADGFDPALYGPPYCPGAPLREDGGTSANVVALRCLSAFLHDFGTDLLDSQLVTAATIQLSRQAIIEAASVRACDSWVETLCDTVEELLFKAGLLVALELEDATPGSPTLRIEGGADDLERLQRFASDALSRENQPSVACRSRYGLTAVIRRQSQDGRTLFLGLFNPSATADVVTLSHAGEESVLRLPAGAASLRVHVDGELIGALDTQGADLQPRWTDFPPLAATHGEERP